MTDNISSTGSDSNGNPCNYVDYDGTIWIYVGKRHGVDEWEGIPKDD